MDHPLAIDGLSESVETILTDYTASNDPVMRLQNLTMAASHTGYLVRMVQGFVDDSVPFLTAERLEDDTTLDELQARADVSMRLIGRILTLSPGATSPTDAPLLRKAEEAAVEIINDVVMRALTIFEAYAGDAE